MPEVPAVGRTVTRTARILLVEDLPDDAFFVERMLASAGIDASIFVVCDEEPFRQALGEEPAPDLVLTDNKLPRFSAWTVLDIVRELAPGIPVALVSGTLRDGDGDVDAALRRGAQAVVRKSELKSLPGVVRRLLAAR